MRIKKRGKRYIVTTIFQGYVFGFANIIAFSVRLWYKFGQYRFTIELYIDISCIGKIRLWEER